MNSPLPTIALWFLVIWLMGWLMLPAGRRIFGALPDGGLAAGRVLLVVFATLLAFWGASLHLIPLSFSPLFLFAIPALCALLLRNPANRAEFIDWVRANRRSLLFSELVFLGAFLFFGWIRWRHPELNEFEKPMDAMLISGLSHTRFLPMDNPWLAGVPFTNYYYYGPLMGSVLARTFATPAPLAYNLVQPLFSAFFVATLWSLCSAITRSPWRGFVAMSAVALLGHFEPLRQIAKGGEWWPFDWWSTSRVVENTINEYPFFTLALGDAHAHFYALALAALFFCICYSLFAAPIVEKPIEEPAVVPDKSRKGKKRKAAAVEGELPVVVEEPAPEEPIDTEIRHIRLILFGMMLGVFVLTNTWDAPLYCLLGLGCALMSLPRLPTGSPRKPIEIGWSLLPVVIAPMVALPYLRLFKSPVGGFQLEFWLPPLVPLALFWGVFALLGFFILVGSPFVKKAARTKCEPLEPAVVFSRLLLLCGLIAVVAPMFFYLRGKFEGDLRHQDTVFKFWLQGWVLLGVALACGVMRLQAALPRAGRALFGCLLAVVWLIPFLNFYSVSWARGVRDASREVDGSAVFSIDGGRFLPANDRAAIDWLRANAQPGDVVMEATYEKDFYSYQVFGRVATFSGVPSVLGWSQHVWFWGADLANDTSPRWNAINDIYAWRNKEAALEELRKYGVRYVFVGDEERGRYDAAGLQRLKEELPHAFEAGDTFIAVVPQ